MMASKTSTTLKPQSNEVAGVCSPWQTSYCDDGSYLLPELSGLCQYSGRQSTSEERRSTCMSAVGEIPGNHQNGSLYGGKEDSPVRTDVNAFGNEYPGINSREGGGGNEDEGTVAVRKKRTWTTEEDEKLKKAVEEYGSGNWMIIERCSGLGRTSKSCRLRWTNHLRPHLKKGSFSEEEERTVVMLHQMYGNRWSFIASKLPGRTDNEVKNFWHGRLRRCRKQYLDVYPPILGDEKTPHCDLNSPRSHFHDQNYSSADTDYTSHISQSSFDQLAKQQNPTSCNTSQKPSSSTSPNQNQLLSLNQVSLSSPHGLTSSHQLQSPRLYTNQMLSLPNNTIQSQSPSNLNNKLLSKPPPIRKFSSPEQGSINSAPSSSVFSSKLQGSSLASQVSSSFNSSTKTQSVGGHISIKQPTTSPSKLNTLLSPVSCNQNTSQVNNPTTFSPHSRLELTVTTPLPNHSHFQVNPFKLSSLTSSSICNSSKLELPVTSPLESSLSEMWLNSSLGLEKPFSLGFQLPQSQLSPSHFNTASSSSPFAVKLKPELPSFQSPENVPHPVQEVITNLYKIDTENTGLQGAHIQEPLTKTDILYPSLAEEDSLDNKIPSGKIFENGKTRDNRSNESTSLYQGERKEGFICDGWETINSSGSQVPRKNLQSNKRLKTENLRRKISRREGLLAEISKTGVLLVEKAKKERLVSKLLNKSSKPGNVSSQSPKTENLKFGEISEMKDLLGDSMSIEDLLNEIYNLRDEKSDEDVLWAENSTLLGTEDLQETSIEKSSSESVWLTSDEQDEMHDLDEFGSEPYKTTLLKPDGIDNELNTFQNPLDQISRKDALPGLQGQEYELETTDAMFGNITSMNQFKSGNGGDDLNYVGPRAGDCLNKNLRREYSEISKKEFIEQVHSGGYWGESSNVEGLLLASKDQHMILDDLGWGIGRPIFSNMPSSVHPDVASSCIIPSTNVLLEEAQRTENSLSRKFSEESSRKRYVGESSIGRVHGLQELNLNYFHPLTTQSTTSYLLSSDAQCFSRITIEEEDRERNIQPEELSSLLEFFPGITIEEEDRQRNIQPEELSSLLEFFHGIVPE